MFDGDDTGVRYADDHIGRRLNVLADVGVLDETAVMVSSDRGEWADELLARHPRRAASDVPRGGF